MTMIPSDEEFEAYVAQQQQELTGEEDESPRPAPTTGLMHQWNAVFAVLVPIGLATVIGVYLWKTTPDPYSISHDPWDNILGATAWATGREYNADADTITERFTLRLPGDDRGDKYLPNKKQKSN